MSLTILDPRSLIESNEPKEPILDLSTRAGRRRQGQRIRRAAEDAGLSLEELAREIGCSRALIFQYASGGVLAQPARLQKIAERTGRTLAFFYQDQAEDIDLPPGIDTGQAPDLPAVRADGTVSAGADALENTMALQLPESETPLNLAQAVPSRAESVIPRSTATSSISIELSTELLSCLEELADSQEAQGDLTGLLATCERILPYARELRDREREARAWLRIGNAHVQRGHFNQALPAVRVALALFESLENTRLALSCRQTLGRALLSMGDAEGAMHEFQQVALGPSWQNRWQGHVSVAAVHEHRGEFATALERCEDALEFLNSETGQSQTAIDVARSYVLSNLANVYLNCGDFHNAHQISKDQMRLAERASQREQFVEALLNLAVCHFHAGQWCTAEESTSRAADLSRFAGDTPRWAMSRAIRAGLLGALGHFEAAKREAKEALRTAIESSMRRCEIESELALGMIYVRSANAGEALYHLESALNLAEASQSVAQAVLSRCGLAEAQRRAGSLDQAIESASEAGSRARRYGIQHGEALSLLEEALARFEKEGASTALELAEKALSLSQNLGMASTSWRSLALLARIATSQDAIDRAIGTGRLAITRIQQLREQAAKLPEGDAMLEDPDVLDVYAQQVLRLRKGGANEEAMALIAEVDWPPLTETILLREQASGNAHP